MAALSEGGKAPTFTGKDQNGNTISLKDLKGKKVILYFYPTDDTPTCTTEACNFRDNYHSLTSQGFEVIGVSADTEQSHQKFISKYDLPFTLIADTDKKIINKYNVWGEKQMFGNKFWGILRHTFVIDEKGVILKIIRKVKSKDAAGQILEALEKLGK